MGGIALQITPIEAPRWQPLTARAGPVAAIGAAAAATTTSVLAAATADAEAGGGVPLLSVAPRPAAASLPSRPGSASRSRASTASAVGGMGRSGGLLLPTRQVIGAAPRVVACTDDLPPASYDGAPPQGLPQVRWPGVGALRNTVPASAVLPASLPWTHPV